MIRSKYGKLMNQSPGTVYATLYFFVTNDWAQLAGVFVLSKPFKPSVIIERMKEIEEL
jgi:hypothetical protein